MTSRGIFLSDLLAELDGRTFSVPSNCIISSLATDSRLVKNGDLFFAYPGAKADGRTFIDEAIARGAAAILCEEPLPSNGFNNTPGIPILAIPRLESQLGKLAAKFYAYPAKKLMVIGITGTNGKTTIAHCITTLLNKLAYSCVTIGTLGTGLPGELVRGVNTTPDPVTLQRLLYDYAHDGVRAVALEVSSHGLARQRVAGIEFRIGVFTNLTREHLDYHGDLESYGAAKKQLFTHYDLDYAIINGDDPFGLHIAESIGAGCQIYFYSLGDGSFPHPLFRATRIKLKNRATHFNITSPNGETVAVTSKLLGRFNVGNLLATVAVLNGLGYPIDQLLPYLGGLKPVEGRMECYGGDGKKPLVVIDYAHTPDALTQVLLTLREYCHGALWCVFGCGGERDRGKRALMGGIAERLSDHIIITNDNPRREKPTQIMEDIMAGLLCPWAAEVEYDRTTAIQYAINNARSGDVVLVAGKGHEDYQIIGGDRLPHRDQSVVIKALHLRS